MSLYPFESMHVQAVRSNPIERDMRDTAIEFEEQILLVQPRV